MKILLRRAVQRFLTGDVRELADSYHRSYQEYKTIVIEIEIQVT